MGFAGLHSRTYFSILRATSSPMGLFERAKELNYEALAITDYCSAAGMADALKASQKTGVKLIPGAEINFVPSLSNPPLYRNLVFLAKDEVGYKNLLSLLKRGFDQSIIAFKRALPQITWKDLEEFNQGLICLSGDGQGHLSQLLMERSFEEAAQDAKALRDLFGNDFYLELTPSFLRRIISSWSGAIDQNFINRRLKKLSQDLEIPCVITPSTFYTHKHGFDQHDVLLAINCSHPRKVQSRLRLNTNDFYLQTEEEAKSFFLRHKTFWGEQFIENSLANSSLIAAQCGTAEYIDPKFSNPSGKELPLFRVEEQEDYEEFCKWRTKLKPQGKIDTDYLKFTCIKNLLSLKIKDLTPYKKRLEEELAVLDYKGFCSYMLIVGDFMKEAAKQNIKTGPSRGSVGGSLVGYLGGIHKLDPLKYGLIFERFINKYKEAYPDADQDIAPSGRGKIKAYLEEKYGQDNVANVSNINTFTPKVYARDIARSCQFGGDRGSAIYLGNKIADSIPNTATTIEQAAQESAPFREYCERFPDLLKYHTLCGIPRAWGTHAGGFIIGDRPLVGLVPVRRDTDGNLVLEYDKERAEANGLVKIDILGLTTLAIISHTHQLIQEQGKALPPFPLPLNDPGVYRLIGEGKTECVFQLNGAAVHLCKKVKPKNLEEISIINTLVRPAAKDIQDDFIATKDGKKEVTILHPLLKRAFKDTYGFGLYEECLMVIAEDVAGWDLNDADALRKLTKEKGKNPEKVEKWRKDFISGAVNNKGLTEKEGEFIWDEVVSKFGAYSFNHSHSIAYSLTSYETAYLKAHYFLEFMIANLKFNLSSANPKAEDTVIAIKKELRQEGVTILPPDVNSSEKGYKIIDDKTILMGLDSIKYVGEPAQEEILNHRPFSSLEDMVNRTEGRKLRISAIQALAAVGGLRSFAQNRRVIYLYGSDFKKKITAYEHRKLVNQTGFHYPWPEVEEWTPTEIFGLEKYYLGEGLSNNMEELYPQFFDNEELRFTFLPELFPYKKRSPDTKKNRRLNSHRLDSSCEITGLKGILKQFYAFRVRNPDSSIFGQEMARGQFEDRWGNSLTLLFFPEALERSRDQIQRLSRGSASLDEHQLALFIEGTYQHEGSTGQIFIVEDIIDFKEEPQKPTDESLKAQKISMKLAPKRKKVKEYTKEELKSQLELEMVEKGFSLEKG